MVFDKHPGKGLPLIVHRIQRQQEQLQWWKSEKKNLHVFIYCMLINGSVDCYHLEYSFVLFSFFKKQCLENYNKFNSFIWNNLVSVLFSPLQYVLRPSDCPLKVDSSTFF